LPYESQGQDTAQWEWATPPNEKFEGGEQEEAFNYGPAPLLLSGGYGSGKTAVAIFKLLCLAQLYPGYRVAIARRFWSELKETTLQTFYTLCPPEAIAQKNEGGGAAVVTLTNGSRFVFLHLNRVDAISILRGLEINAALIDQAEETAEEIYDTLHSRIGRWKSASVPSEVVRVHEESTGTEWPYKFRNGKLSTPSFMLLTCNPDLETHWLWNRFHPESEEWQSKWKGSGYKMITFDSRKNKFLSEENLRILQSKDDTYQARYVRGEWGNPEGVFFRVHPSSVLEYSEELMKKLRETCKLYRVLDHGDSGVTCVLWAAVDGGGNVIFYRELYLEDQTIRDTRANVWKMSVKDSKSYDGSLPREPDKFELTHYRNLADPSIFYKVPQKIGGRVVSNRWSVAEEWVDSRNYPAWDRVSWEGADNNEQVSRQRIKDMLLVDPGHSHPITREKGAPRMYFVKKTQDYQEGCFDALLEVKSARRVQVGTVNGKPVFSDERDDSVPDHALDCVAPETKILRGDLRWIRADEVKVGDTLVGFDEFGDGTLSPRHWRPALVESVEFTKKPSYRTTLSDGTVVVSSHDHRWLSDLPSATSCKRKWVSTASLDGRGHWEPGVPRGATSVERLLLKPLSVWKEGDTRSHGYLAGMFDGEGSLSQGKLKYRGIRNISMSQKDNSALEDTMSALRALGFQHSLYRHTSSQPGVCTVVLAGTLGERLRFLGEVRPRRLLEKLDLNVGRFQVWGQDRVSVVRNEYIGVVDVVAIKTSTRTFMAEGLASHNCVRYISNSRPVAFVPPKDKPGTLTWAGYAKLAKEGNRKRRRRAATTE